MKILSLFSFKKLYSFWTKCEFSKETCNTFLIFSCWEGDLEECEKWIRLGADINTIQDGSSPVYAASRSGNVFCLLALVNAGANWEAKDETGSTALHAASRSGSIDCVKLLLSLGADIEIQDEVGQTPLFDAAQAINGSIDCASLLLSAGANPSHIDKSGKLPYQIADIQKNIDILLHAAHLQKEKEELNSVVEENLSSRKKHRI